jgi:hypothetical protein
VRGLCGCGVFGPPRAAAGPRFWELSPSTHTCSAPPPRPSSGHHTRFWAFWPAWRLLAAPSGCRAALCAAAPPSQPRQPRPTLPAPQTPRLLAALLTHLVLRRAARRRTQRGAARLPVSPAAGRAASGAPARGGAPIWCLPRELPGSPRRAPPHARSPACGPPPPPNTRPPTCTLLSRPALGPAHQRQCGQRRQAVPGPWRAAFPRLLLSKTNSQRSAAYRRHCFQAAPAPLPLAWPPPARPPRRPPPSVQCAGHRNGSGSAKAAPGAANARGRAPRPPRVKSPCVRRGRPRPRASAAPPARAFRQLEGAPAPGRPEDAAF